MLFRSVFAVIRMVLGYQFRFHDEVIIAIVISAAITVGYLVFTGTRELFTYKSNAQMLETKNGLLLENYHSIESYMNQIALIKHEMKNHLFATKILLDNREYDRLTKYLTDFLDSYLETLKVMQYVLKTSSYIDPKFFEIQFVA